MCQDALMQQNCANDVESVIQGRWGCTQNTDIWLMIQKMVLIEGLICLSV
ncbi:MAG: hypothetical protein ACJAVR_003612 [Paracoccaceae bacterium]|jgi:hypothetical protein